MRTDRFASSSSTTLPSVPRTLGMFQAGLGRSFNLRRTEAYVVQTGSAQEDWLGDAYTVLEFVPRKVAGATAAGSSHERNPRRL